MTKKESSSVGMRIFDVSLLVTALAFLGGCASIQTAARKGDLKEVRRQLAWGVNVNSETFVMRRSALHEAAGNGHAEIVFIKPVTPYQYNGEAIIKISDF